jgi:putative oxidoreductase
MTNETDVGLLILRVVVGLLVAAHGVQKLSHWLGGDGIEGSIKEFADDGFRGGLATALAAGGTQLGAGLMLAAGLITPAASAGVVGVMVVAASTKLSNGPWVQHNGYEFPALLAVIATALAWTGPGDWSLDHVIGLTPWSAPVAVAATVAGIAGALGMRMALHRPGAAPAEPTSPSAAHTPTGENR